MKLSIITINYNNCTGLQKTIDSIVAQTWRDFEWIIIDGGSTDGSKELIEKYQEYFAYWCSEPDKGIYNAMNKGIAKAKGEYLNFMNSGDTFYEYDTLQKVFCIARNADVLYGDAMQIHKDYLRLDHLKEPFELFTFWHANFCHQSLFVRSSLLKDKGFDESYRISADYKKWVEFVYDGCCFEFLNIIICYYDYSGLSSTQIELRDTEFERARNEVLPPLVKLSLDRMNDINEKYVNNILIKRYVKPLEEKGGIASFLMIFVLKIFRKLFV